MPKTESDDHRKDALGYYKHLPSGISESRRSLLNKLLRSGFLIDSPRDYQRGLEYLGINPYQYRQSRYEELDHANSRIRQLEFDFS